MDNIRNFSIIAHIDHGKSTLADRFLELTKTVESRQMRSQYLDMMDLEQERGITIKMQPVRMVYHPDRGMTLKETRNDAEFIYGDITYKVRGALFEVRKRLGLGHKEAVYHNAIEIELEKIGLVFQSKKNIPIVYSGRQVGTYQPDFIIEGKILLELKALPEIEKPQIEQLWSYLKGCSYRLALLVNFGSKELEIKRIIYDTAREYSADSAFGPRVSAQIEDEYILNLIDTPGHVDFSYEVSRSLAAVEGAILLIDGTKGVQAQTLAHLHTAQKLNLVIIPAINKIDLANSRPEEIEAEIKKLLGDNAEVFKISAKDGTGVAELLEAVIEKIPPPIEKPVEKDRPSRPFGKGGPSLPSVSRALIFDSAYDAYKGVVAFVRVFDGGFKTGHKVRFIASNKEAEIMEVGYFKPQLSAEKEINEGEIGYIATGLKDPVLVRVGDTIASLNDAERTHASPGATQGTAQNNAEKNSAYVPLPGYQEPRPVVFASLFPKEGADFAVLKDALGKLKLSDAALSFELDSQEVLGRGFRCGFLGSLHMEIVLERLKREYNLSLITTMPSVSYEIVKRNGEAEMIFSAADLPEADRYTQIREPWVALTLILPSKFMGSVLELLASRRGVHKHTEYLSAERVEIVYEIPLAEIIVDFHDKLKSVSSGFASFNYEFLELRAGDLIKLDVLVAGEKVDALSRIIPRVDSQDEGRRIVQKLKELLPREWFQVTLQAAIGGKIIAREDISALKKDVTGYLYGGDITRKMKLREKQKKGKKKMKARGRVNIPNEVFFELLKR